MNRIDDETLMAFADDMLPAVERARVEAALAADPQLRARLAVFAGTPGLLRPLDTTLDEPIPPRLAALAESLAVDQAAAGRPAADPAGTAAAKQRPSRRGASGWLDWLLGAPAGLGVAAASLTLGVALGFGTARVLTWEDSPGATASLPGPTESRVASNESLLERALQSTRSGERLVASVAGRTHSVSPTLSIRTDAGEYCREFVELRESGTAAHAWRGLACRSDGRWTLRVLVAESTPAPAGGAGYTPASDARADVDALLDRLAPGEALSTDAESRALAAGWRD